MIYIYIYIYIYNLLPLIIIGLVYLYPLDQLMSVNGSGNLGSIPGRVTPKNLKLLLDTSLIILSNIRYVSRVKWSNQGKGVAPSPTPRCSRC